MFTSRITINCAYVYTTIDHLPRAEFSIPNRVLEILSEILVESAKMGCCALAPIVISNAAPMNPEGRPFEVIIDGNNRLTALTLLRFLATQGGPATLDPHALYMHCIAHGLGFKWQIDLQEVFAALLALPSMFRACPKELAHCSKVSQMCPVYQRWLCKSRASLRSV